MLAAPRRARVLLGPKLVPTRGDVLTHRVLSDHAVERPGGALRRRVVELPHRIDHDAGDADTYGHMHVERSDGERVCGVHGVVKLGYFVSLVRVG